ncbi:MAG TPA: LolA-related protein [Steroidobacteraceae bacterium]|nr:LolA-related protein [Steroidobacteraceae bacterium]
MSRHPVLVLLLVLLLGQEVPAAETADSSPALDEVLQLLAQRRHGHVSFSEVQKLAMLDQPLHSSGELLYDAPDRLEKRTLQPKPEDLVLEHGTLIMQRGTRRRVLSLHDYPQAVPFVESIRATLAGDRRALEQYFVLQFSGSLASWTLELTPREAVVARSVEHVRIDGERDAIRTVEIRQRDGDLSLLTIGPELRP